MSARDTYRRIGCTEEEIDNLIREQEEDDAADREEPLESTEVRAEFEPRPVGDRDRKCGECGVTVPALPFCGECGAGSDDHPF